MKAYRLSKGVTEHYTSFEELRVGWNLKPVTKQTSDKSKLEKQREDFCKRHVCSACKKPMVWIIGTNYMACQNPECKGIKREQILDTGETKIWYIPSIESLDERGASIAENLFTEYK